MLAPTRYPNLREGYVDIVHDVREHGHVVHPRGYETWEIEDATFEIENTRELLPAHVGRGVNPAIGGAEALLLCAGLASPSLLTSVTGTFRMFLDGGQLHGAYGPRVRPQMESVIRRLRSDRDSRQAIVQIWDPLYDGVNTRDLPCTLGFGFRLRGDGLHMSSTMRSQDVWLGLAYDLFFFGQLGHTVANVLGVEFVSLRHHAYSLHLYARNEAEIDYLHDRTASYIEPTGFHPGPGALLPYELTRQRAEDVYNHNAIMLPTRSERWYNQVLDKYDRLTRTENFTS